MINRHGLIGEFTRKIDNVVTAVASKHKTQIADEDDFTSQLLGRIEATLDGWQYAGITLRVTKLTSKGPQSEEAIFGADIIATVNINLEEYRADKGILVQAKRLDTGQRFKLTEWNRLKGQIEKMNTHTDESYVWCYNENGVHSIKASILRGLESRRPEDPYISKCAMFLGELVQCKHGDRKINGCGRQALTQLGEQYRVKSAISLSFRDTNAGN
ncbi:MAG: hypothetical protein OXN81_09340 [Alphaproteobacteria bacterium]|nr:hypothetical protein [Alphaproteobacteria bacterium]